MEIFCLRGYGSEKILLKLSSVMGFPDSTSYEGGYDILCTLEIDVGCYGVKCEKYYSATGALYRFADQLRSCYETLQGQAEYRLLLEDDLTFTVAMTSKGHAHVTGAFRQRPHVQNVLTFEMETDQTFFPPVIQGIDELKKRYGGFQGSGPGIFP